MTEDGNKISVVLKFRNERSWWRSYLWRKISNAASDTL